MSDTDIEKLLSKGEGESLLTTIDDVPIESEDVHIVYRFAKQTQFEATAEQGVWIYFVLRLSYLFFLIVCCFTWLYSWCIIKRWRSYSRNYKSSSKTSKRSLFWF